MQLSDQVEVTWVKKEELQEGDELLGFRGFVACDFAISHSEAKLVEAQNGRRSPKLDSSLVWVAVNSWAFQGFTEEELHCLLDFLTNSLQGMNRKGVFTCVHILAEDLSGRGYECFAPGRCCLALV